MGYSKDPNGTNRRAAKATKSFIKIGFGIVSAIFNLNKSSKKKPIRKEYIMDKATRDLVNEALRGSDEFIRDTEEFIRKLERERIADERRESEMVKNNENVIPHINRNNNASKKKSKRRKSTINIPVNPKWNEKLKCADCYSLNEPHFKFCTKCGSALDYESMDKEILKYHFQYEKCIYCFQLTPVGSLNKYCVNCGKIVDHTASANMQESTDYRKIVINNDQRALDPTNWNSKDQIELNKLITDNKDFGNILDECTRNNNKGINLEKDGKIDQAIEVYERNIVLRYPATHSYWRLIKLYRKEKDYNNELRIINIAIDVFMDENERRASDFINRFPSMSDKVMDALETNTSFRFTEGDYALVLYDVMEFINRSEKVKQLINKTRQ